MIAYLVAAVAVMAAAVLLFLRSSRPMQPPTIRIWTMDELMDNMHDKTLGPSDGDDVR